jgi:NAD(P)-dependent dehydrogenase (short-subunit alcohol dehydrogenase family)
MVGFVPGRSFADKVVVITGAASGIGLALCRKFACEGSRIVMLDADKTALNFYKAELADAGYDVLARECDVVDANQCQETITAAIERWGGIDVLINNAGITQRSPFLNTDIDVFKRVMAVNFFGSLHCTKAALNSLMERKGLIIVNESIAGVAPLLGRTAYSASKYALHGLFTSLRTELRESGVHVMIVCPGFVKTNLQTCALGGDGRVTDHPQSRVGAQDTPENTARAIYRGAVRRKYNLVLTPVGKLGYWMNRIAPLMYERLMARQFRSELDR